MLFNSLEFAIFLPLVVGLYFCLPSRYRTPMLLIASCIFYMAFIPVYILILFVTITIDYIAGIYVERSSFRFSALGLQPITDLPGSIQFLQFAASEPERGVGLLR